MSNKLDENLQAFPVAEERTANEAIETSENAEKRLTPFQEYLAHPPTREEVLQRMSDFPKRREAFIAAIRKTRVEIYLPDAPKNGEYRNLLEELRSELAWTFGGSSVISGVRKPTAHLRDSLLKTA